MSKNYKFIDLQSFAWDKVMNSHKRFRRVFDIREIAYLGVELSFYNKLYDEKDWKAKIVLKAYTLEGDTKGSEHCNLEEEVTVSASDNVFAYINGWGSEDQGVYWDKGNYLWEAYIDGKLVGTSKFYFEDLAIVTDGNNPFFEIESLQTYEAPAGDMPEDDRTYIKTFEKEETRYVMGEIKLKTKVPYEWLCEMFFNYYEDTGQRIGVADILHYIMADDPDSEVFTLTGGWGSDTKNTWMKDKYLLEVVFMDTVVASIPFEIGDTLVERSDEYEAKLNEDATASGSVHIKKNKKGKSDDNSDELDIKSVEELLNDLDQLIGLEVIKKEIREHIQYVRFLEFRKKKGFEEDEDINIHSIFTGNPGTGKTTVVKKLGMIYKAMGLLSKGHVHTVESSDLISGYIRQTGKDTKKQIAKARGGILFIDEAYTLVNKDLKSDYGGEAIAALLTEISDGKGDIAIMLAGYPQEMKRMVGSNPGIKSRFTNHFHFDDYIPAELTAIADYAAKEREVTFSDEAKITLEKLFTEAFRKRDRTFGNGRFVNSVVDEAKLQMGIRLMSRKDLENLNKTTLETIEIQDIEAIEFVTKKVSVKLKIDEELLASALDELDDLLGLENIKQDVRELIKLVRYYNEIGKDVLSSYSAHTVFTGNPGTGKTTVARIMGKVYKALGMLERGHLIDADSSDMIAGYTGQTALKTKDIIQQAMGGILFIDEAYAITDGRNAEFGKKAIAILVKQMEDNRNKFGVIVAGYPKNMRNFLESNPGLKSRFDRTFSFEDFTSDELYEIALLMLSKENLKPDDEAAKHLQKYLNSLYISRTQFFGNARSVRKIVEKSARSQNLRMADLPKNKRTKKMTTTLILADVAEFKSDAASSGKIGFRL